MSNSLPTFAPKVDRQTQSGNRQNLVVADDINQMVNCMKAIYLMLQTLNVRTCIHIDATNFAGQTYQNGLLVGLTPDVDFRVFTNEGSGVLLYYDTTGYGDGGYDFAPEIGILTMNPQGYSIEIYTPVTLL